MRRRSFFKQQYYTKYKDGHFLRGHRWAAGRTATGSISVYTKGFKNKWLYCTGDFRTDYLKYFGFVSNIFYSQSQKKLLATIITLSGVSCLVAATANLQFWKLCWLADSADNLFLRNDLLQPFVKQFAESLNNFINPVDISNISRGAHRPVQYARAAGVTAMFLWTFAKKGRVLLRMPSQQLKEIILGGCVLFGKTLPIEKNKVLYNIAGYWRHLGFKPTVRGVAKNPVDHPHGGREKTVACPVTPWGKITKKG